MKTLYTNGCSFTFGDGLITKTDAEREELVYTGQIGKLMPFDDVVNEAMCGGSNQRIVRKTLDYFIEKINAGENVQDHVALIQWSNPSRFEVFDEEANDWITILPSSELDPSDTEIYKLYHQMYEYYTFEQELANTILYITVLGNFFEKYNIKYMFVDLNGVFHDDQRNCDTYATYYEFAKQYTWYREPDTSGIAWMPEYEEINSDLNSPNPDFHPNEASHAAIGKTFTEKLIELYPTLSENRAPAPKLTREELVKEKIRKMKERDPFIYK